LTAADTVIEVGPGLGILTERLAAEAGRVIAVELDTRLCDHLRSHFAARPNVTIVAGDVLRFQPAQLLRAAGIAEESAYKVVANLPYNIGAAVVRHFLEADRPPTTLVVMLQREVADAITAAPGRLSLLGVSVQVYARAKRLFGVPPRAFYPAPKVTSAVLRLDVRAAPLLAPDERERFFAAVRAGFSAPRKQLRNTLAQGLRRPPDEIRAAIEAAGIDARLRPQDLAVEDWLRLARTLRG
jgi:16S rRNA (adenine1518-N6/adenine1519-N6)-dimethyltransferase